MKRIEMTDKEKTTETEEENKEENSKDEIGGPKGLEPTRYGDWESKGRCVDF